uniref:Uncharacterized protein n=1 Tax=Cacopsylla melanoneura TaxID=428564 RepID=A0A8D8VM80_9HEMI
MTLLCVLLFLTDHNNKTYAALLVRKSEKSLHVSCDPLGTESETESEDIEEPNDNTRDDENSVTGKRKGKKVEPKPHWRKEQAKYLRNTGQAYVVQSGSTVKVRQARSLQPPCLESCKLRCFEKFTHERRKAIFREFWDLGDLEQQRVYIAQNLDRVIPKYDRPDRRRFAETRRSLNTAYHLAKENGVRKQVCKTFFLNTLDVTNRMINIIQRKMRQPEFTFKEERGNHVQRNRGKKTSS